MFLYEIVNLKNGKRYIGQTTYQNPNDRWSAHKSDLRKQKHCNQHLQRAWNKYGEDSFSFNVLSKVDSLDELNNLEAAYVGTLNHSKLYNIRLGGNGGGPLSESTKKKLSKVRKEKKITPWNKGRQLGEQPKEIRHKKSMIQRKYEYKPVISPDGSKYEIHSLREFCRQHNLHRTRFLHMLRGKVKHCNGWKTES